MTGLNCRELAAELSTFVPGRRLDDNVQIMLRFAEGARGLLWASQVAAGKPEQSSPARLRRKSRPGMEAGRAEPPLVRRTGQDADADLPRGTGSDVRWPLTPAAFLRVIPEGYLEAFAQLYADMAEQISARIEGRPADRPLYWCRRSRMVLRACALSLP